MGLEIHRERNAAECRVQHGSQTKSNLLKQLGGGRRHPRVRDGRERNNAERDGDERAASSRGHDRAV